MRDNCVARAAIKAKATPMMTMLSGTEHSLDGRKSESLLFASIDALLTCQTHRSNFPHPI